MPASSDSDEVDFKPFFDLIVGILFILLILISAQMFFAQKSAELSSNDQANQLRLERARQVAAFLEDVTQRLRSHGLTAELALGNRTVVVGTDGLLSDRDGIPVVGDAALSALATSLAEPLACASAGACAPWPLVRLNELALQLSGRDAPAAAGLAPDRYLGLATATLSAALFGHAPSLLRLSAASGAPLIRTGPADAAASAPPRPVVRLGFLFAD